MEDKFGNELSDLSPFLADLKKQRADDAFKTPKFYFDNLADTVLAQAQSVEKVAVAATQSTPQYTPLFERLKSILAPVFQPKLAMAFASLVFVAAVSWWVFAPKLPTSAVSTPQNVVVESPSVAPISPIVEPIEPAQKPKVGANIIALKSVDKEDIDGYISENIADFDGFLVDEDAPKLAHTEGVKSTPSISGLTEEELELYLEGSAEEDLEGSDNQ